MRIKSITTEYYVGKVYDLVVNKQHKYFANSILVHNCHCRLSLDLDELRSIKDEVEYWDGGEERSLIVVSEPVPDTYIGQVSFNSYLPEAKIHVEERIEVIEPEEIEVKPKEKIIKKDVVRDETGRIVQIMETVIEE